MRVSLAAVLALCAAALAGCYETGQRVVERGADVGLATGTWRCQNTGDGGGGTIVLTGPVQTGPGDVVYRAVVEHVSYVVRMERIGDPMIKPGELILVEVEENGLVSHVFLRAEDDSAWSILVPGERAALEALAGRHDVRLDFSRLGPPKPRGTPAQLRAFLKAHTGPELRKTSTCRKAA